MKKTSCTLCGKMNKVDAEKVGKRVRCQFCDQVFRVESTDDNTVAAGNESRLKSSKKRKKLARSQQTWFWPTVVGGGVFAICLLAGVVVWLTLHMAGAPADDGVDGDAIARARPPSASSPISWIPPVAISSANPGQWQATIDPAIAPKGILSLFPVRTWDPMLLVLGPVASGQAAVIGPVEGLANFCWFRYDLRQSEPVSTVPLQFAKEHPEHELRGKNVLDPPTAALSASGDRLAVRDGSNRFVGVWAKDGKRLATIDLPSGPRGNLSVKWLGFAGEDRLWMLTERKLTLHEVATGKVVETVPFDVACPPTLTPGGKWLVICGDKELIVVDASDGKRAGTIALPGGWGMPKGEAALAMHPSGSNVALVLTNERSDRLVAAWDLASGQLTDSLSQSYQVTQRKFPGDFQWIDTRQLLCGNTIIDLDLHIKLCSWSALGEFQPVGCKSPDGRLWRMGGFSQPAPVQPNKNVAPPTNPPAARSIIAGAFPTPLSDVVKKAKSGFRWFPGTAIRVAAGKSVPRQYRQSVAESFAGQLAAQGYRIDPEAAITLEIDLKLGEKTNIGSKQVPMDQLTPAMREELRRKPNHAWYELMDVYNATVQIHVLDSSGKLALETKEFGESAIVEKGASADAAWKQLANRSYSISLPSIYLRDPAGQRLFLPDTLQFGVDGILDAQLSVANTDDGFGLPQDGKR